MIALDDIKGLSALDPENMYQRIYELPEQIQLAQEIGKSWKFDAREFAGVRNIVLSGMGGSAIGGDLLRAYMSSRLQIPFHVVRNYRLPEYVDDESLVIVSSYSGNTEETLSALNDAFERKALIIGLTTGGKVGEVASAEEFPIATLPTGYQPRAAIALSFVPLLYLFEKLGYLKKIDASVTDASMLLSQDRAKLSRETQSTENLAKGLALKLHKKVPIIYAGPDLTEPIAVRWRGQISENAKNLAYSNSFPELNHNELVGWSRITDSYKANLSAVILRDEDDNPRVKLRMDLFAKLLSESGVDVTQINSHGPDRLSRMFSLIQFGDFVSYYLSALNEVDPTPVDAIENLKRELAKHPS